MWHSLKRTLLVGAALLSVPAVADQSPTIPPVRVLNVTSEELLRPALRERGYIEGKNIIEWRRSQGERTGTSVTGFRVGPLQSRCHRGVRLQYCPPYRQPLTRSPSFSPQVILSQAALY